MHLPIPILIQIPPKFIFQSPFETLKLGTLAVNNAQIINFVQEKHKNSWWYQIKNAVN